MKRFRPCSALVLGLALVLAATPPLPAQSADAPPEPPPSPAPAEASPPALRPDEPTTPPAAEPGIAADGAKAPAAEPEQRESSASDREAAPARPRTQRRSHSVDAPPFGDHGVAKGNRQSEVISLMGNTTVDGHVTGAAVSILGDTTVNGRVDGAAVSVLGTTTINGSVGGEAVAILGDVVLGPGAEVEGEVVAVLGRVIRGDGARIHGKVAQIPGLPDFGELKWLQAYLEHCVRWGRPLWFGEHLGWAWAVAAGFLVLYLLLALIFPRGIERCAAVLDERPGSTLLATVLTALLTPLLMVLLVMTGIGIVLIPFLLAGLVMAALFGKAAILAWFGQRVTRHFEAGPMTHAVVAVCLGGLIVTALYLIPFLGFLLQKLFSVLGLGMAVYVLILSAQRERAVRVPAGAGVASGPGVAAPALAPVVPAAPAAASLAGPVEALPPPVPPAAVPPVLISASTLPRAGFWLRLAAGLLDLLLIGITVALIDEVLWFRFDGPGVLFLGLAAYSATLWKLRGTTIGGIICGLKVVRTDDRPIDWTIAIVRALAAFLSLAVAGLGFIWVAFDDEKQSWHDKIAGTTIVKVPKGIALL